MIPHVTAAEFVQGYQITIVIFGWCYGNRRLKDRIVGRGGVFAELEDPVCFAKFSIDTEAGTLCWPNGVDFCPTMLHAIATGHGSVAA